MRRPARLLVAMSVVGAVLFGYSVPSEAHDPVFLTRTHRTPEVGPLLPDGTISFAIYGGLSELAATQGFQARLKVGEALNVSLLIPAVPPETTFEVDSLPRVEITRPDGSSFFLAAQFREMFHEPFTNTRYLRLGDHLEVSQEGEYDFLISSARPGRYVVSIGTLERFGTTVHRYTRPLVVGRSTSPLLAWFETEMTSASIEPLGETSDAEIGDTPNPTSNPTPTSTLKRIVPQAAESTVAEEPCDCGRPRRWVVIAATAAVAVTAIAGLKVRGYRRNRRTNESLP